jgi:hypothetical protein
MPPPRRKKPNPPPKAEQLEFTLVGRPEDKGLVRARAFVQFLEDALETLANLERRGIPNSRPAVDYRIVELGISSAVVALEPIPPSNDPARAAAITKTFTIAIDAAHKGQLDRLRLDPESRSALERLVRPSRTSGIASVEIRAGRKQFKFTTAPKPELKLYPPPETSAVGSFTGYLDAVNVHADPVFYLYPVVGPLRITCVFAPTMIEEVRQSLRRYCTVYGLTEYVEGTPFPYRIVVERIAAHPAKPTTSILDLYGIAPDLTRGKPAEVYIRAIRDASA